MRLSEVGEYSQRVVTRVSPPETSAIPDQLPREALRRYGGGLAVREVDDDGKVRTRLGELVQVVT